MFGSHLLTLAGLVFVPCQVLPPDQLACILRLLARLPPAATILGDFHSNTTFTPVRLVVTT